MTEETKQTAEKKAASLDEILEAVSKKEAVVKPFTGKKKNQSEKTVMGKSFLVSFLQGLFFGLGFMAIVGLVLFTLIKINQLQAINTVFYKLVYLLRALGK